MKDVNNLVAGIRPRTTLSTSRRKAPINRTVRMSAPTSARNAAFFRFMVRVWVCSAPFFNTRVNPDSLPFSWKVLLSGYTPAYAYESGRLDRTLPFEELQQRSLVRWRT
jgi:hypothetical protein